MAGFLAGLGSFAGGASQGIQSGVELAQRLQQIKQGQMALDLQKKQLAADPAVARWLSAAQGGQGAPQMGLPGPGGPTPPPAQGAAPVSPQGPQTPAQAMPPGQPSVPGGSPPQGQGASPPGGPATAPPPQPGGGGPLPQQTGGDQAAISDPMAPFKVMQTVASQIKAANPGIDPQTLFYATQKVIDQSKGIQPDLRAQASYLAAMYGHNISAANTQTRAAVTERGQNMQQENVGTRVASQEKIAAGHDATSLQRVVQQGSDAMARTQASIAAANQRAADGTWSREKVTAYKERANAAGVKLKAANSRLTALTNSGVKPDDPRVAQAMKDIGGATAELDRVNKAAGLDTPGADAGAKPAAAAAPPANRGPATHMLKGKPIWPQGDHWVYEDGTEAK